MLQGAALRWTAWPLAPVGYVVASSWYMQVAWFSLLLGWAAKVLILKFGGSKLFMEARPLFVGMVFGEALAAGVWLINRAGFPADHCMRDIGARISGAIILLFR